MKAGTGKGAMAEVVEAITTMDTEGLTRTVDRDHLSFNYRRLSWPELGDSEPHRSPVIINGVVKLQEADAGKLKHEFRMLIEKRREAQPVDQPSAGCFFKNPPVGKSAGELIERSGLKGKRVGEAEISKKHANFIVNRGKATAEEILELSRTVQETVRKKFNVILEPEVKIVGE